MSIQDNSFYGTSGRPDTYRKWFEKRQRLILEVEDLFPNELGEEVLYLPINKLDELNAHDEFLKVTRGSFKIRDLLSDESIVAAFIHDSLAKENK